MTENVENLVLEHLKRFQVTMERVERGLRELKSRQTETYAAVLSLRRDQISDAEVTSHLQVKVDAISDRVGCIERHLELQD